MIVDISLHWYDIVIGSFSIGTLTKILVELLREHVSIRNMRIILEALGDFLENTTEPEILVELKYVLNW